MRLPRSLIIAAAVVLSCAAAFAATSSTPPAATVGNATAAGEATPAMPAAEEMAKDRLATSPRHAELVSIDTHGTPIRTWIVYPERHDKAPAVIVIHEIFGLTDWIRVVADRLAADGFIALAPDLLSGKGPGGGTDAFASRDDVIKAVSGLASEEVLARLDAVREFALALPAASGRVATIGFCWGGTTSFAYAAAQPKLDAAVVYYGTAPQDPSALERVHAPVLGLYGGEDARVTTTVDATAAKMKELGKTYEPHVFAGAGHGFLRAQSGQAGKNLAAARATWPLTVAFLRRHLSKHRHAAVTGRPQQ